MYLVTYAPSTYWVSLRDGPWGVARSFSSRPGREEKFVARRPRHYVRSADRLGSADHQVATSGVIDPLRTSPEILPDLLAYVLCMLELPPQVGGLGGVPLSTPAAIPPQAAAYHQVHRLLPLRQWHSFRYQCTWLLARYLPKIPPKIPATGMVEAA
jgi:hypothetical protein